MKTYEVVVLGGGSGSTIADHALSEGKSVAFANIQPPGGTCQNYGCIPSKMLIFPADRIREIQETKKLGIHASISSIDFSQIMQEMRDLRESSQQREKKAFQQPIENLDYYPGKAVFVDEYTVQVENSTFKGEKIFICTGARPRIPPIKNLDTINYLTNETVLELKKKPKSMIIIGGGYVAVEYGHFFSAMGTKVTMVEMGDRLVPGEEPEISQRLKEVLSKYIDIHVNTQAIEVNNKGKHVEVTAKNLGDDSTLSFTTDTILIAAGRSSNADLLQVEKTGVETDEQGYIMVNEYLETNKPNIYAIGDATGQHMFKHVANHEAYIAWHNATADHKASINYQAIPHAIYTYPQIASVGLTEEQARKQYDTVLVGESKYDDVAKGGAMKETNGFAKAVLDGKEAKLLGFHIIGPYAPILIQETINVIVTGGDMTPLSVGMHIHPALTELILSTLSNIHKHEH